MRRTQKPSINTDLEKYVREHYNIPDPVYSCSRCGRNDLIKSDFYSKNAYICKTCLCAKNKEYVEQKRREKEHNLFYELEDPTNTQTCIKCYKELSVIKFPKEPAKSTGRGHTCSTCISQRRYGKILKNDKNILNTSMARARFRSTIGIQKVDIFDISENHIFFKILKEDEDFEKILKSVKDLHTTIGLHKPIQQDLFQEFDDGMILKANISDTVFLSNNLEHEYTRKEAECKFLQPDNYVKVVLDIIINCQTGAKKVFQAMSSHLISL